MEGLFFEVESLPGRVVFGAGRVAELPAELERLGIGRPFLFATASSAPVVDSLATRFAGRIDRVRQHVPADTAEEARSRVMEARADGLVALGGGSAIGLAKAVALSGGPSIVAIPTTYSGSEMTPIWGITAEGRKTTGRDLRVLPRTVVYDPELTLGLPPGLTAASGMNALAHAAEALWLEHADPITLLVAEEATRALATALPRVVARPGDLEARTLALHGAHLAGRALATVGTGLHHKLAHVLGGSFDLPHADVHAVLLPYTAEHHAPVSRLGRALGTQDPAAALWALGRAVGTPPSLAALGLTEAQADEAATDEATRTLLGRALRGDRPKGHEEEATTWSRSAATTT